MAVAPITQSNTLQAIELIDNPIPVELTTGGMITTPGERAGLDIEVATKDNAEDLEFRLQWANADIIFTTKTTPDQTGIQIPAGAAYGSISDWLDDVVIYLQKNELLFTDFRIWHVGDFLKIEAYLEGEDYTLTFTTSDLDWSVDWFNDGVDEVREENFKFVVGVHVYQGVLGDFESQNFDYYKKVKTFEIEPLSDQTGVVLINEAIKPYFKLMELPTFNLAIMAKNYNLLLKYFYRYSEKFGVPAATKSTTTSDIKYALNGGITRADYKTATFWSLITGTTAKFLTWHPKTKYITKQQHDYLYFIQTYATTPDTYVRFVGIKENGSSATVDVNIFYGSQYDVHVIPVHHNYVKTLFSSDMLSYTVQVITKSPGVTIRSEKRTFNIIQNTPLTAKYYLFKNGLGVFESIMFDGEKTKGVEVDKITAERILQHTDAKTVNNQIVSNVQHTISNKMYTGFKSKDELDAFIDFIRSKEVFEQTATYYKPVSVDTKNTTLYSESDNISSASINIPDNPETNYSNA